MKKNFCTHFVKRPYLVFCLCLGFMTEPNYAQEIEIKYGPKIESKRNGFNTPDLIYNDENTVHLLHCNCFKPNLKDKEGDQSYFCLQEYDNKYSLKNTHYYEFNGDFNIHSTFRLKDRSVVIISSHDNPKSLITYKAFTILKDGTASKAVLIKTLKYDAELPQADVIYSADQDIFIFTLDDSESSSKDIYKIFVMMMDKDLNEILSREIKLKEAERQILKLGTVSNSKNEITMWFKVYEDRINNIRTKSIKSEMRYIAFSDSKLPPKEYNINFGEKFICSMELNYVNDSTYLCTGQYSNILNGLDDGAFSQLIQNHVKTKETSIPFTPEMNIILGKDPKKEETDLPRRYKQWNYTIANSDGKTPLWIISEMIYGHKTPIFYYKLNTDFSISDITAIPREEYYNGSLYSRESCIFANNEELAIFYNHDRTKFRDKKVNVKFSLSNPVSSFDMMPALYLRNTKGETVVKTLIQMESKEDFLLDQNKIFKISPNKYLLIANIYKNFVDKSSIMPIEVTVK